MNQHIVNIVTLGYEGVGLGYLDSKPVYVPYTNIGEQVKVEILPGQKGKIYASLVEILAPSPVRQQAPCQHFTVCGGCALQHLTEQGYVAYKQEKMLQLLQRLQLEPSILLPMVKVPESARRRVELKVAVQEEKIQLGYYAPRTHQVVDIEQCVVMHPSIMKKLPALKELVRSLKKPGLLKAIHITLLKDGLDIILKMTSPLADADKKACELWATQHENDLCRLAWQLWNPNQDGDLNPEMIVLKNIRDASIELGDVSVDFPLGGFLQATQEGQEAITHFILAHLSGENRVADIYSGCGTYSFPLVKAGYKVGAYEGSEEMVLAIHNAMTRYQLDGKLQARTQDLIKSPISVGELNNYQAAVVNPPRNGAAPQLKQIAKSQMTKVIMVSCNLVTFERDARYLLEAGFKLQQIQAIDQFYYTPHLECVAFFDKK